MSSLALAMYVVAVIIFVRWGAPASLIVARFLDMITVAVPPALPASMQVNDPSARRKFFPSHILHEIWPNLIILSKSFI
jgi:magnesium-transporting ATPase (P-type)